ncbi:hypothetical protein HDV02_005651 [Globomyces sp. JEL0801]|nr:hypothetical protein HDV02_005651 [Globomyces sp. JEL0801]
MCYVCRSPISKGYNHFMDKKCPLWDDSASRNLEDVTRAKTIRLNAIGKMIPNDLPATLIDNPNGSLVNDPQNGKRMDPLRNAAGIVGKEPLPQPTQDIRPNINLLHHIRRRKAVIIKASALQREANPPHHIRQILPVRPKQAVGQLNPPNDIIEQVLPQKPAKVKRIMDPQETTNLVAKIDRIRRRRGDIIKELDLQPERNPPHYIRQILPVKPKQTAGQLNPPNLIVEPEISHRPVNIKRIIYPQDLPGKPTEDAGQMVASIGAVGLMLPRKHRKTTRSKPTISREVVDLSEDIVVRPRPPSIEIIDISDDGIGSVSPFTISKKKRPNI